MLRLFSDPDLENDKYVELGVDMKLSSTSKGCDGTSSAVRILPVEDELYPSIWFFLYHPLFLRRDSVPAFFLVRCFS